MNTGHKMTPPALEDRITAALERKAEPQIPADFAASVAAKAAAQPLPRRRMKAKFGSAIALFTLAVAMVALFALAPHAVPNLHSLVFDTELALLGEIAVIGWWISTSSRLSR